MKIIIALVIGIVISSVHVTLAEQVGDMDGDSQVSLNEAIIALRIAAGLTPGESLGQYISATGNATTADVMIGMTFSSSAGNEQTGTMKIRGDGIIYTNSIGMEFSLIPAGSFVMGTPAGTGDAAHYPFWPEEAGRVSGEKQHVVTISNSFYMQTTEVTQSQWSAIIVDKSRGINPSNFSGEGHPVERVNWYEAASFANWLSSDEGLIPCYDGNFTCNGDLGDDFTCTNVTLIPGCTGYRLPTESEWEYAARAGTVSAFYNGGITNTDCGSLDPNLDKIGWYCRNASATTHQVAQKDPNAWGLYDMSGNVYEWCQDRNGTYPDGPAVDPAGDDANIERVIRGGSLESYASKTRSGNRWRFSPSSGVFSIGFRLALPPSP